MRSRRSTPAQAPQHAAPAPAEPITPALAGRERLLKLLFDQFYPVHYKIGMIVETLLSRDLLTRKQFSVLWMIQSLDAEGSGLPRKQLEAALSDWLELRSPAVSLVLKELSSPALGLIAVATSNRSGREKVVRLTGKGREFIAESDRIGLQFITKLLAGTSEDVMQQGVNYLDEISRIFDGKTVTIARCVLPSGGSSEAVARASSDDAPARRK